MGNSALIATKKKDLAVYLHWNGGRDSVEAFLLYCKMKDYGSPEQDCYGWARLCQVVGNFFGGSSSLGIDAYENSCGGDNGIFFIENWEIVGKIVGRANNHGEQRNHDLNEMLLAIDKAQPESEQLGEEFLTAKTKKSEDLQVGDMVFIQDFTGKIEKFEIVGQVTTQSVLKGEHISRSNGHNVLNKFFVNKYDDVCGHTNINNFLLKDEYRVVS